MLLLRQPFCRVNQRVISFHRQNNIMRVCSLIIMISANNNMEVIMSHNHGQGGGSGCGRRKNNNSNNRLGGQEAVCLYIY